MLASRRREALEEAAQAVRAQGREALIVPVDLAVEAAAKLLVEAALQRFGTIDISVAAAGIYYRCACEALTSADIERVMAVNFHGSVRCLLAALPHMVGRQEGNLVVVSSLDGKKGLPPDAAYVASKFALSGFAEVLRQELHGTGVHVSTIFPGRVDTPMIEGLQVPPISAKVPPEMIVAAIVRAVEKGKAEVVVPLLNAKRSSSPTRSHPVEATPWCAAWGWDDRRWTALGEWGDSLCGPRNRGGRVGRAHKPLTPTKRPAAIWRAVTRRAWVCPSSPDTTSSRGEQPYRDRDPGGSRRSAPTASVAGDRVRPAVLTGTDGLAVRRACGRLAGHGNGT